MNFQILQKMELLASIIHPIGKENLTLVLAPQLTLLTVNNEVGM